MWGRRPVPGSPACPDGGGAAVRQNRRVPHNLLALFDMGEESAELLVQQPPLPVPSAHSHLSRIVADSTDRVAWLRARSQGITATDVAKLATEKSVHTAAREKINGSGFGGNPYTDHGRAREPEIAAWVLANYGIEPSTNLFHAAEQRRHLATPDGLGSAGNGVFELAEIKTTSKPWRSIPRSYLRQIWWQQYVLGADRTLLVWEEHDNFVPRSAVPECRWIDRDDDQISILVGFADQLIDLLNHQRERERAAGPPSYDYGR